MPDAHPRLRVLALALLLAGCGGSAPGDRPPDASADRPPDAPGADSVAAPDSVERPEVSSLGQPASVGGLQARRTVVPGVMADLLDARREEGALLVTIRFRNSSESEADLPAAAAGYAGWSLRAGEREWPLLRDEGGELRASGELPARLAPAESRLWRGEFQAPPPDVETFALEIPGVEPFEGVPIQDD